MRGVYRFFAGLIALEVLVQAGAVVYGVFGLRHWVEGGATLTKSTFDEGSDVSFRGLGGLALHGMNGMMIIPVLALLFLIVSFFAKVPKGILWALAVLVLVVIQVTLGLAAPDTPILGALHGINALLLFSTAVMAFVRSKATAVVAAPPAGQPAQV
jgi:hypothetical protein